MERSKSVSSLIINLFNVNAHHLYELAIICIFLLFQSCVVESFDDPGNTAIFNIETANYKAITVKSIFDIALMQDSANYITVECGENLKKNIFIEEQNNTLLLSHDIKPSIRSKYKHVKLKIHLKNVSNIVLDNCIKLSSIGTITQKNLQIVDHSELCEVNLNLNVEKLNLTMKSDNISYYTFSGFCKEANILMNGSSILKAVELQISSCKLTQASIGGAYLNILSILEVKFLQPGKVFCKGNPTIRVSNEGLNEKVEKLEY